MIVIYKRIEKRMEQGDKHHSNPCYYWSRICSKQGDKEGQQGDKSLFFLKRISETMKIKLFTRELVPDGTNGLGFQAFKPEPDKEFEKRINDFMIDKNVVSVQSLKDSVFVTYTD